MHPSSLAAAALLLTLVSPAVLAGPSQDAISSPGGLANACATEISSAASFTPGGDLEAGMTRYAGRYACQSEVFGGDGQAQAGAEWHNGAGVDAGAQGRARLGVIDLHATNASNASWQYPGGAVNAGWSDTLTFDLPGQTGTAAVWLFTVSVNGRLGTRGVGGAGLQLAHYGNEALVPSSVAGYAYSGTDPVARSRQHLSWSTIGNVDWTVDSAVTFALPVTFGEAIVWGGYAHAYAGQYSQSSAGWPGTSDADFLSGIIYGGPLALMVGGQAAQGWTLSAASGHDWLQAAAVPEPAVWMLLLPGLLVLRLRRAASSA